MGQRVPRRPGWIAFVALALAIAAASLALAPAAGAAKRQVPVGFFGSNWDSEIALTSSKQMRVSNWKLMADTGVESARTTFLWSRAQPRATDPVNFVDTDAQVKLAMTNGIRLLPVVASAPRWARESDAPNSPPKNRGAYANYIRELIVRYGIDGTFWEDHPRLPKHAIRAIQIANEPSANYQWTIPEGQDWAPGYGALLRRSYKAIKATDPGAKVVLAGLPNQSYQDLEHLYKAGHIHGYFDVAALHPYTHHDHGVLTISQRFRAVMKKYGDEDKQLWITELGLPASKGRSSDPSPLQTTDQGMADFLTQSYTDLMKNRRKLNVPKVYWYTWASNYKGWIFNYTGLRRYRHRGSGEEVTDRRALKAYRKLARDAQGR